MIVNLDSGTGKAVLDKANAAGRRRPSTTTGSPSAAARAVLRQLRQRGRRQAAGRGPGQVPHRQGRSRPVDRRAQRLADRQQRDPVQAGLRLGRSSPKYDSKEYTKGPDQSVPDWDNTTGRHHLRADADPDAAARSTASLAANDGLGNAAIAVLKKNKLNGKVPVTGQDADRPGPAEHPRRRPVHDRLQGRSSRRPRRPPSWPSRWPRARRKTDRQSVKDPEGNGTCPPCCWTPRRSPRRTSRTSSTTASSTKADAVHRRRTPHCAPQAGIELSRSGPGGQPDGRPPQPPPPGRTAGSPSHARRRAAAIGHPPEGAPVSEHPCWNCAGVDKSFGPVQVLHDVDFSVYPGQVTALVGDNGAGKSTLVKCVSGIYAIDAGEFLFEGRPVTIHSPRDAAALGIEIVYQDLALCDNLDIVQNMFLGRETALAASSSTSRPWSNWPAKTLAGLSVRTVKSVRQHVVQPLRRPAPDGGDRQGGAVEQPAGHPRRADRGARRGPDRPGARTGPPAGRQRARRRAHLAQHERRLRGLRPDRRALPRAGWSPRSRPPTSRTPRWSS